ncbi:MTH1187 family thiamine-binding protein [Methermicoccus shengliensis]|uniref:MTH1187 family thiamine-binding protein n=1 Tax=Methermicoccus shengliensis TaxID=660064 RepID=A0A832RS09_9EURY|nr:MTH1187 family thiamine-binding protein [Methermicoccus shengliensis]KUK04665.1 MAG: hypothetical protein XD46_0642 [Euryarchaeota archaeon 55_53]KUK30792.1 MAG: hypothetical protein XD62_0170 [Methanosarcinales archeaon 56_1174]MDI3487941.1 hypothetical protein [Methanosarcinales archaeon]MDN5295079.1 hypothetical protein [Methanosarcinales archaeon]HIH69103.1 MTH1187 family thiamine-binding protein [Methermicoccus shengliensis]
MVIAEISIVPLGTNSPSVSKYVAEAVKLIEQSGLAYELTPMGTVVEGELGQVLELLKRVHEVPFLMGAQRVVSTIRIDDRRDVQRGMREKVNSVKSKLEP